MDPAPPWMCVLAGWLLASTQLGGFRPGGSGIGAVEAEARMPAGARRQAATDPDRMSPRELRRLPGIGPMRALAIARARWEQGLRGGPETWEDLPGIGPETVGALRRALAARALEPRVVRSP